ncbi:hypothetical protein E2C01_026669 [Portunus trituberculatus]|uniref:Uncharacterized protein n=1 Tax=Portunus trituberculatus TaxID=210409 RepID=A0A5B7EIT2_PORTR|nr:hypothetical protein [Portunus trituberculatus]
MKDTPPVKQNYDDKKCTSYEFQWTMVESSVLRDQLNTYLGEWPHQQLKDTSWKLLHTLTGWSQPRSFTARRFGEQLLHTPWPHARQWWRGRRGPNSALHTTHSLIMSSGTQYDGRALSFRKSARENMFTTENQHGQLASSNKFLSLPYICGMQQHSPSGYFATVASVPEITSVTCRARTVCASLDHS